MKTLQTYFEGREDCKDVTVRFVKGQNGVKFCFEHKDSNEDVHFAVMGDVTYVTGSGQGTKLDFSQALALMKDGKKVGRSSWSIIASIYPQKVFICLKMGTVELEADKFWNPHSKQMAIDNGGTAKVMSYFIRCDGNVGTVQMGWTPSQEELLANDWYVVV